MKFFSAIFLYKRSNNNVLTFYFPFLLYQDHSKKFFSFNATSCNTAVLTNNEKEDSYRSESEIGLQSGNEIFNLRSNCLLFTVRA